ncbi:hypothetical protein NDU88_005716 [Pleurodeles waltl]|uniref:Uncharacterized protein n=1 Tax=Pleurodeles waltl TaxID=8319 RepID=A0AAV7SMK0_PLEWA|nr:hypothetical protein NDU88_005716 [Pleurodeles waltl]
MTAARTHRRQSPPGASGAAGTRRPGSGVPSHAAAGAPSIPPSAERSALGPQAAEQPDFRSPSPSTPPAPLLKGYRRSCSQAFPYNPLTHPCLSGQSPAHRPPSGPSPRSAHAGAAHL